MYLSYWKLKENPFENTPDPRFLYHSPQHEEALSRLVYVVRETKGFGLLTGTYGCGKTLLAHALFNELEKDVYRVAYITNPRLDDIELLRMILHSLGFDNLPNRKADLLIKLEEILIANINDGRKTVLVIDEAHAIELPTIFEELRLLLNYQYENQFMLSILLLGQPELKGKVDSSKQLSQRISMRYHLSSLSREETELYIFHRLVIAGSKSGLFDEEALGLIFDRSGGIPRRINQICDLSLLNGMHCKSELIDSLIIKETIDSILGG